MHIKGEFRSFSSALAHDELARSRDDEFDHDWAGFPESLPLAGDARENGPLFSLAAVCNLLTRIVWRSKKGEAPDWRVPS